MHKKLAILLFVVSGICAIDAGKKRVTFNEAPQVVEYSRLAEPADVRDRLVAAVPLLQLQGDWGQTLDSHNKIGYERVVTVADLKSAKMLTKHAEKPTQFSDEFQAITPEQMRAAVAQRSRNLCPVATRDDIVTALRAKQIDPSWLSQRATRKQWEVAEKVMQMELAILMGDTTFEEIIQGLKDSTARLEARLTRLEDRR